MVDYRERGTEHRSKESVNLGTGRLGRNVERLTFYVSPPQSLKRFSADPSRRLATRGGAAVQFHSREWEKKHLPHKPVHGIAEILG